MKICPDCNGENRDEAIFCTKCGNKFEGQSLNTDVNAIQNGSAPMNTAAGVNQVIQPAAQPSESVTPPIEPTPKKKSNILVYIIGIIAVIAVVFLGMNIISNANPANKLVKGLAKLSKMDKATSTTTIDITYDGDEEEIDFLNEITIKLETAADINNLLAQISLDLLYSNKSVVQVEAGANNEDFYIDLKDLHKEIFYQSIEDVVPDYQDYVNDYKIIKKALDGISVKFDEKKYIKIVKDVLDDDIKGSGNKVTVTLNAKNISKLTEKILEEAEDDKKLMESIRKNAIDFLNEVIDQEKKFKIIEVDDFEDALEIFEDKDDFEDYYQEAIASALDGMDYMDLDIDDLPEMEITFRFGSGNTIKGIDYTGVIEEDDETIEIIVKTDIKSGANFTKFNRKNAIEIEELLSGGEIEDVAEEVSENLIKAIKKNKNLKDKIEELTGEDIEDSIEMMMYGAFRFAY
ncbi:MAG: hypothetical protein GX386_03690 [Clostridiaceae bacterium]|jgi:hypothetical protein|nr:hypothetical protein [Clostridiaceae bacterium]